MPQTWMVTVDEAPYTRRLGQLLRLLRHAAGMTQRELADNLALGRSTLTMLELGRRRTRLSTLREIAAVLAPLVGRDCEVVLAALVQAAGPALAAESARSEGSIARKRKRKAREDLKHDIAMVRRVAKDSTPVEGGPRFMLRRRLNAELDRVFPPTSD